MARDSRLIRVPGAFLLLRDILLEQFIGLLVCEGDELRGGFVEVVGSSIPFLRVGRCAEFVAGRSGGESPLGGFTGVKVAKSAASAGHCAYCPLGATVGSKVE